MTVQERFEEALDRYALAVRALWERPFSLTIKPPDCGETREAVRSAHATCVEEARVEGEAAGRVDSASRIVQAAEDAYERGLREGAGLNLTCCLCNCHSAPNNMYQEPHPDCTACMRILAEESRELGRREGLEREREECVKLLLYCGFEGSAAAIRARSKGGDASV